MLSRPDYGWSDFQLGEKSYSLGYLTNVPFDWLTEAIHGLDTMRPFTVHGFSEPGRILCTVSYWNCYILFENDKRNAAQNDLGVEWVHVTMLEFCKILYRDILNDLEAWADWDCDIGRYNDEDYEIKMYNKNRTELLDMLNKLEKLIKEKAEHFGDNRFFC